VGRLLLRLIGPGSRFPGIVRRASIDRSQFPVDLNDEFECVLDVSLVHDVVPADALRGLGRPSTLIMRAGLPALRPDRAVLHRKNALFYRTLNGAQVGDLFMSLIHTCQFCGVNSFDYLTELQRHVRELTANPAEWMPWTYRETLARVGV